jgi:hypothetical protein
MLDLELYLEYCEVEILDLSKLLNRQYFSNVISKELIDNRVFRPNSYLELYKKINKMIQNELNEKLTVYNAIPNSKLSEFLVNQFLKFKLSKSNVKVVEFQYPGFPNFNADFGKVKMYNFYKRKFIFFIQSISNPHHLFNRVKAYFFETLNHFFLKYKTHLIIAGNFYLDIEARKKKTDTKIIEGSSQEYSLHLRKKAASQSSRTLNDRIIFLDANDPYFYGDGEVEKASKLLTSDLWYPKLNIFFEQLEHDFDLPVVICGHPKTSFQSGNSVYGRREVVYGQTYEQVQRAEFTITRLSSAVAYPIIQEKPIIFLKSNEMFLKSFGRQYVKQIEMMAAILGQQVVNIDDSFNSIDFNLKIDPLKYDAYVKNYLTSRRDDIPNHLIVIKEIILT